jgi:Na+-transporting NADH:ubiquinone oxidoreductase subunit D
MANKPWPSLLDGIGNGIGYGWVLLAVGFIRELFGSGSLWGYHIIPQSFYDIGYKNNGFMILPPMALIIVGAIIWIQRSRNKQLIEEK